MKPYFIGASLMMLALQAHGETINFDSDVIGERPKGWHCGSTGKGVPRWTVEQDKSAPSASNVLKQSGQATFPWCVVEDSSIEDGNLQVTFKALSGKEDQAAGLVWRWKDGGNYYVARANALEKNVSLYYTENGVRKTIQYVNAPVSLNNWHTIRVTYRKDSIQVALDGKVYINKRDSRISGPGKAGVWTKADSVTAFDNFSYANTPGK
jgi:hypothetical protein